MNPGKEAEEPECRIFSIGNTLPLLSCPINNASMPINVLTPAPARRPWGLR